MAHRLKKGNSYFSMLSGSKIENLTAETRWFRLCLSGLNVIAKFRYKLVALFADELLRHTAILFAGMMAVHVCNLIYQMVMGRVLPDAEFALLAAFLSVLAIVSYPLSTLTTGLSHYSSLLRQAGRGGDVKRLLRKWLLLTGIPALLLGAVVVVFNGPVAGFIHLNRFAPVIIAGAILPAMFWLPVLAGAAQGLQLFGWSSASGIFGALIRLLLGAGFVWFLYPACGWAMLGHGAGIYASAAVLAFGLVLVLRGGEKTGEPLPRLRFYLLQSFFPLMAFAVLMNADVVLVKHYLPDNTDFAYASTLGRIVAFLPAAVAMAMFPKVASSGGTTAEHRRIFLHSFGYTVLCVAAAAAGCLIFPQLILRILWNKEASDFAVLLIRLMALAMSASALLNVTVQFLLAQRRFKALIAVLLCSLFYLLSAYFFHRSAVQIAVAAIAFNMTALFAGLITALRFRGQEQGAPVGNDA
jgi:O-antigen/teichoic acid export membrane protein